MPPYAELRGKYVTSEESEALAKRLGDGSRRQEDIDTAIEAINSLVTLRQIIDRSMEMCTDSDTVERVRKIRHRMNV